MWIYYGDRAPNKSFEVWKVSRRAAKPGDAQRITTGGGDNPLNSPDGTTVYYSKGHGDLWSVPAGGGPPSQVFPRGVHGGWFSVTSRGIFFADLYPDAAPGLSVPRTPKPIRLLPFGSGQAIEMGRIAGEVNRETPDFTVSADGRMAWFSILETSTSQIRMLESMR